MSLREAAFVIWIYNCLVASVLAYFLGWTTAVATVAVAWLGIVVLGIAASFADSWQESRGFRSRVSNVLTDAAALSAMVAVVLGFPVALLAMHLRERFLKRTTEVTVDGKA